MFEITKLASGRPRILIQLVGSHKFCWQEPGCLTETSDLENSQSDIGSSDVILNFTLPAPAAESSSMMLILGFNIVSCQFFLSPYLQLRPFILHQHHLAFPLCFHSWHIVDSIALYGMESNFLEPNLMQIMNILDVLLPKEWDLKLKLPKTNIQNFGNTFFLETLAYSICLSLN